MKYIRPAIEVEAMMDTENGDWLVQYPDGKQVHIQTSEFQRDFRKMNGQDPVKKRRAPVRKMKMALEQELPDDPFLDAVEPAQEYDHQ